MIALRPYVRLALFQQAAIVLDLRRSRYLIYEEGIASALAAIIDGQATTEHRFYLTHLQSDEVLREGRVGKSFVSSSRGTVSSYSALYDYRNRTYAGFSSGDWACRKSLIDDESDRPTLRDMLHVLRCCAWLKIRGFTEIRRLSERPLVASYPGTNRQSLVIALEAQRLWKATLWSPFHVACLQWSVILASRLRTQGVGAKVVIGVRPMPFIAHAWVEVEGEVIADEPNLRSFYGVIFEGCEDGS